MKLDHEYFKAYLHRLSDYDSKKCHELCNKDQTPEHLMTVCYHFKEEQKEVKKQLNGLSLTSKMIFTTKEETKAALQFLKKTKVETRKWLLRKVNYEKNENEN